MENAPLNQAHFYERRAEKHLKHGRFDDAVACLEKSILFIQEAYSTTSVPKALEILDFLEKEYKRQLQRVHFRKSYFVAHVVPTVEEANESPLNNCSDDMKLASIIVQEFDNNIRQTKENKLTTSSRSDTILLNEINFQNDEDELAPLELPTFDFFIN